MRTHVIILSFMTLLIHSCESNSNQKVEYSSLEEDYSNSIMLFNSKPFNGFAVGSNSEFSFSSDRSLVKYVNGRKQGIAEVWAGETKLYSGEFNNGLEIGTHKEWYINGNISSIVSYKEGKMEGPYKGYHFDKSGQLSAEGNYKEGKKEGLWKWYYENGQIKEEKNYKNDTIYGKVIKWSPRGKKLWETIYNGNGEWKEFYGNGNIKSIENFDNYILGGKCKYWNKAGKLYEELMYDKGEILSGKYWIVSRDPEYYYFYGLELFGNELDGESAYEYYEQLRSGEFKVGPLSSKITYKNGLKNGFRREFYNFNGLMKSEIIYKNDSIFKKTCWDKKGKTIDCADIPYDGYGIEEY